VLKAGTGQSDSKRSANRTGGKVVTKSTRSPDKHNYEKEADSMEEQKGTIKENGTPAKPPAVPETPARTDEETVKEKEKEPEIPVTQVPMDGVCGGY